MPIRAITFRNDRDHVVATVGEPLRWGRPDASGTVRRWSTGPRVLTIADGATYEVWWDPEEAGAGWNNPIYTGHPIELVEDPSEGS